MLTALAYLPPQFVLTAFETLKSQFSTEALAVYIYFQDTYVQWCCAQFRTMGAVPQMSLPRN